MTEILQLYIMIFAGILEGEGDTSRRGEMDTFKHFNIVGKTDSCDIMSWDLGCHFEAGK